MDQPPHQPPRRGTQPLSSAPTKRFSDAFVSSQGGPARGGKPLAMPAPAVLRTAVPQRLEQFRRDLSYVRHLTSLFETPIGTLRYAIHLITEPPEPVPEELPEPEPELVAAPEPELAAAPLIQDVDVSDVGGWQEARPVEVAPPPPPPVDPLAHVPPQFRALPEASRRLADDIAQLLLTDDRMLQRLQVTIFQFDETLRGLQEASDRIEIIYKCSYEEAWNHLNDVGIERLKGKAYAICGFYEHYKGDAVLNRVFPPPNVGPRASAARTTSLSPGSGGLTPVIQPVIRPVEAAPGQGIMGMLKNLFGKN